MDRGYRGYKGVVDRFLAILRVIPNADEWLLGVHTMAVEGCPCAYHAAQRLVIRALERQDADTVRNGALWIKIALWCQVDHFIRSTLPMTPDAVTAILVCRTEVGRLVDGSSAPIVDMSFVDKEGRRVAAVPDLPYADMQERLDTLLEQVVRAHLH